MSDDPQSNLLALLLESHVSQRRQMLLPPHRDPNKSGQFVVRSDDAQAPAAGGGQPQESAQGETRAKKGKNQKDDLAKQGVFQRLGEPVISSSPEANVAALALSSGPAAGVHPNVSSSAPDGLDEHGSAPKQMAMRQSADR